MNDFQFGSLVPGSRIPRQLHQAQRWRLTDVVGDFRLEDAWLLPATGGAGDFADLVAHFGSPGAAFAADSLAARVVWGARAVLGRLLRLDRSAPLDGSTPIAAPLPIPGTGERSLSERLDPDLRGTADSLATAKSPFRPLFITDGEFAAELSNRTVHAVLQLGWVPLGEGRYVGAMGVYVKPRGLLGAAYMAAIKPFRHLVVYPALMRSIERRAQWAATPRR